MRTKISILFFLILISSLSVTLVNADSGSWYIQTTNDDATLRRGTAEWFGLTSWLMGGDISATLWDYETGLRFQNVTVPSGVTITSASIEFHWHSIQGNDPDLRIIGEDTDDSATFVNAFDFKARARTTASVVYQPTGIVGETRYNTSDISAIVQEIIDRGGWSSGQDMGLFVNHSTSGWVGAEERGLWYAQDMTDSKKPYLFIEWEETQEEPDPDPVGEVDPVDDEVLCVVYREYNVSSITVIDGIYDVGSLNSTIYVDGNVYRVNETVGADCLEVRFNFSGIPEDALSLAFLSYCEYEGNPAHIVNIEAWNFNQSSWDLFFIMVEHGFRFNNASLSYGDYIENGTGNVWLRWDHVSNGASGHYLTLDFLKLRAYVPVINLDAWSINWLTSLLWLGLLAIGTFKESGTLTVFAGFLGLILGILMLATDSMVGISLILLNLYLIYTGS